MKLSDIRVIPHGQADCFLITLDNEDSKHYILIDGGSKLWKGKGLPEYIEESGILEIDLMILTHLHQDHIGWLEEISHNVRIHQAVLPFSAKETTKIEKIKNREVKNDYKSLCGIEQNLILQGTKIAYGNRLAKYQSYIFGEYCLTAIYPSRHSRLPFYEAFCSEGELTETEQERAASFINGDSSVWLLTRGKIQIALFCGDCFEENFAAEYQQYVKEQGLILGMQILKLSHHGRNDKGHIYFTESFVNQIKPKEVLITNTDENILIYQPQWQGFSEEILKNVIGEGGIVKKIL